MKNGEIPDGSLSIDDERSRLNRKNGESILDREKGESILDREKGESIVVIEDLVDQENRTSEYSFFVSRIGAPYSTLLEKVMRISPKLMFRYGFIRADEFEENPEERIAKDIACRAIQYAKDNPGFVEFLKDLYEDDDGNCEFVKKLIFYASKKNDVTFIMLMAHEKVLLERYEAQGDRGIESDYEMFFCEQERIIRESLSCGDIVIEAKSESESKLLNR